MCYNTIFYRIFNLRKGVEERELRHQKTHGDLRFRGERENTQSCRGYLVKICAKPHMRYWMVR